MTITTYTEAREYLESLIKPIPYKKVDADTSSYDPLARMRMLLTLLDNPEKKFKSIQVSGTSGKGSTAYLISHLLTRAGYKTGFTLSPHLMNIRERMQINETLISEEKFIDLVNEQVPVINQMKMMEEGEPTYFEALMSLTFLYFAREKVDIAVVEVGLEGRYDGTNTLDPLLFVLTNISLDHIEFLGDTDEKIVREALGAVENKNNESRIMNYEVKTPVVITGAEQKEVKEIIRQVCTKEQLPLLLMGEDFGCDIQEVSEKGVHFDFRQQEVELDNLFVSLLGEYQALNTTLALETVFALKQFDFSVAQETIYEALKTANFPGRFEKVTISRHSGLARIDSGEVVLTGQVASQNDLEELILDGAHNPAKMQAFVHSLQKIYPNEKYTVIFACKKHKDITQILKRLAPVVDTLIVTQYFTTTEASKNSSMTVDEVLAQVEQVKTFPTVLEADTISKALAIAESVAANTQTKIIVTGSLYLVGEAKNYLSEKQA